MNIKNGYSLRVAIIYFWGRYKMCIIWSEGNERRCRENKLRELSFQIVACAWTQRATKREPTKSRSEKMSAEHRSTTRLCVSISIRFFFCSLSSVHKNKKSEFIIYIFCFNDFNLLLWKWRRHKKKKERRRESAFSVLFSEIHWRK